MMASSPRLFQDLYSTETSSAAPREEREQPRLHVVPSRLIQWPCGPLPPAFEPIFRFCFHRGFARSP